MSHVSRKQERRFVGRIEPLEEKQAPSTIAAHAALEPMARSVAVHRAIHAVSVSTSVGQIPGTVPAANPGSTVTVKVGLTLWNAIRPAPLLGGPITMSVHGSIVATAYASSYYTDSYGTTYGLATFSYRIPTNAAHHSSIALQFHYQGNSLYSPSTGSGSISVK